MASRTDRATVLAVAGWRDAIARLLRRLATAADGTRTLPISVQHQLQSNWCWAACATSTSGFYDPATTWGQCRVVNAELGNAGCCEDGGSGDCNIPWYLDRVLRRTGNFGSKVSGRAPLWLHADDAPDLYVPVGRPVGELEPNRVYDDGGFMTRLRAEAERMGALYGEAGDADELGS
jgi:hypothetical protein